VEAMNFWHRLDACAGMSWSVTGHTCCGRFLLWCVG